MGGAWQRLADYSLCLDFRAGLSQPALPALAAERLCLIDRVG